MPRIRYGMKYTRALFSAYWMSSKVLELVATRLPLEFPED